MTSPLYSHVHTLATTLLQAASSEDAESYQQHYETLQSLCYEHQEDDKNHPLQWETLADFTEDPEEATVFYQNAIGFADEIQAWDYLASAQFALAQLIMQTASNETASAALEAAIGYAEQANDKDLITEIKTYLQQLSD